MWEKETEKGGALAALLGKAIGSWNPIQSNDRMGDERKL